MVAENPYRILLHRQEILEWNSKNTAPLTIDVEPTWFCNHKCSWCAYLNQHSKRRLNAKNFEQIVSYANKCSVPWILVSGGGEPCTNPDIELFFRLMEQSQQRYMLTTNGYNLNEVERSIGVHCGYVRVSLDAGTRELFSIRHCCPGSHFDNALMGIQSLKSRDNPPRLGVSMVVTSGYESAIQDFALLGSQIGIDEILIKGEIHDKNLDQGEITNALMSLPETVRSKISVRNIYDPGLPKSKKCYASRLKMIIDGNGDVSLCCLLRGDKYNLGNINSNMIEEIWQSNYHRAILNSVDPRRCPTCRFTAANDIFDGFLHSPERDLI